MKIFNCYNCFIKFKMSKYWSYKNKMLFIFNGLFHVYATNNILGKR